MAIVLSKYDLLESPEDLQSVISFVKENVQKVTNSQTEIYPVDARSALKAKLEFGPSGDQLANSEKWKKSNFAQLESYILKTLDVGTRTKLKLENPLGVSNYLANKYFRNLDTKKKILKSDLDTLNTIEK